MNANLIDKYLLQFQSATERELAGQTSTRMSRPRRVWQCAMLRKVYQNVIVFWWHVGHQFCNCFLLPFAVYDDTCDVGVGLSLCFLCDSLANIVLIIGSTKCIYIFLINPLTLSPRSLMSSWKHSFVPKAVLFSINKIKNYHNSTSRVSPIKPNYLSAILPPQKWLAETRRKLSPATQPAALSFRYLSSTSHAHKS